MPRATNGPASRKRRKRVLLRAKGFAEAGETDPALAGVERDAQAKDE